MSFRVVQNDFLFWYKSYWQYGDGKLSFHLGEVICKRGLKKRKNEDGTSIPLGKEFILSYVKAMADLLNTQKALG